MDDKEKLKVLGQLIQAIIQLGEAEKYFLYIVGKYIDLNRDSLEVEAKKLEDAANQIEKAVDKASRCLDNVKTEREGEEGKLLSLGQLAGATIQGRKAAASIFGLISSIISDNKELSDKDIGQWADKIEELLFFIIEGPKIDEIVNFLGIKPEEVPEILSKRFRLTEDFLKVLDELDE